METYNSNFLIVDKNNDCIDTEKIIDAVTLFALNRSRKPPKITSPPFLKLF